METGTNESYMQRCIDLAKLGAGSTGSNPMVGAVLVYEGRIIGEGYHQKYGEAHAEVNCLNAVEANDSHLIERSVMYVSLEPCAHYGKTPPCADLIVSKKIMKVVIGCRDPFPAVNGKGIEKLEAAGVDVTLGVLQTKCLELNKRFFTFHTKYRPYIILKWAQTADNFIGAEDSRLMISNEFTNRLVHKWRSEEMAIMVGKNTALKDDPSLTTRLWPGLSPVRIVTDSQLELPAGLKLLDGTVSTIVFNAIKDDRAGNIQYTKFEQKPQLVENVASNQVVKENELLWQLNEAVGSAEVNASLIAGMMEALYMQNITSVIVEGGAILLQAFIDSEIWDEARVITNTGLFVSGGVRAPVLNGGVLEQTFRVEHDQVQYVTNSGL